MLAGSDSNMDMVTMHFSVLQGSNLTEVKKRETNVL